jgi:hypothetical protein
MMRKPNTARATSDAASLLSYGIGPLVRHGTKSGGWLLLTRGAIILAGAA